MTANRKVRHLFFCWVGYNELSVRNVWFVDFSSQNYEFRMLIKFQRCWRTLMWYPCNRPKCSMTGQHLVMMQRRKITQKRLKATQKELAYTRTRTHACKVKLPSDVDLDQNRIIFPQNCYCYGHRFISFTPISAVPLPFWPQEYEHYLKPIPNWIAKCTQNADIQIMNTFFEWKSLNAFGSNCKLNAQYFRSLTRTHHEKVVLQIQLINTLFSWDDWRNCRLGKLFFCNYLWLLLLLIPFHRYVCSFNDICTSDVVLLFFVASLFTRFVLCGCLTIKGKFKTIKTVYTLYNAIGAKRRLYNNIVCAWY